MAIQCLLGQLVLKYYDKFHQGKATKFFKKLQDKQLSLIIIQHCFDRCSWILLATIILTQQSYFPQAISSIGILYCHSLLKIALEKSG